MKAEKQDAKPTLIAICARMEDDYRAAVVRRVLTWRKRASGNARSEKAFRAALRKTVRIAGFRNPHKADDHVLLGRITDRMTLEPQLLGSVLQIWIESHRELRDVVSDHLSESGVSAKGLDFEKNCFTGGWDHKRWIREKESVVATRGQFNADDVALMLCCVSGRLPDPPDDAIDAPNVPQEEVIFSQWLEELQSLPADAPLWESATEFVASASEIIRAKEKERILVLRLKSIVAEMKQEFERELAFFQCDMDSLLLSSLHAQEGIAGDAATDWLPDLLRLAERLSALLNDYKPVHDVAPTIKEELARREKRSELQLEILDCLNRILSSTIGSRDSEEDQLKSSEGESIPTAQAPPAASEHQTEGELRRATLQDGSSPSAAAQNSLPARADSSVVEENGQYESDGMSSAESAIAPAKDRVLPFSVDDYNSLTSENRDAAGRIADEPENSLALAGRLRGRPQGVAKSDQAPRETEFSPIDDVRTAVALAREKFAEELLFQPNSKSEIQDNPFERPKKVWDALEWLATTYYRSKMGEVNVPDFDKSIRKACGWHYAGNQSKLTMTKYKHWYTTHFNGKTYWLKKHIGTGSNKDARYTIRIAFDWDKDHQVVVIGYIGQHQQTSAT